MGQCNSNMSCCGNDDRVKGEAPYPGKNFITETAQLSKSSRERTLFSKVIKVQALVRGWLIRRRLR